MKSLQLLFCFRLLCVAFQPVLGCVLGCFTSRFRLFRVAFKALLQPKTGCFVKTYDRSLSIDSGGEERRGCLALLA